MSRHNDSNHDKVAAPLEKTTRRVAEPFREFVDAQNSSGWILLLATLAAIGMANSIWSFAYFDFLHINLGFVLAGSTVTMTLQHWVNEGLMALFFFLLGLELKRELAAGRLSELREAGSVLSAAVGGVIVPATIFVLLANDAVSDGWAVPVATDTAFALMVLALLGERVPAAARAFLVGLAIIDDLVAIIIIALAYTSDLYLSFMIPAAACSALLVGMNLTGVRTALPFALIGIGLWLCFLQLGLHGTLAGVFVAAAAPVRPAMPRASFVSRLRQRLHRFEEEHDAATSSIFEQPTQQQIAQGVLLDAKKASAPSARWESRLEKPISLLVVPVFAFMNAGVTVPWSSAAAPAGETLTTAIVAGLLVGKPAGILAGLWIGTKTGVAALPAELSWRHAFGIGILGGIGFTMSLFIATLSFGADAALLDTAKRSIIGASLAAGIAGYCWLRWCCGSA